MTSEWWLNPALMLGTVIAVGYGALFHLWQGRSWQDLITSVVAALIGFGLGQLIGTLFNSDWFRIGQVRVIEATIFAMLALLLSRRKPEPAG